MPVKQAIAAIFAAQRPNIPERYIEEMQGLADALHMDAQTVFAANSIPEFFHCSGFALLGEITQPGTLLHGRVLDYGVDWKLQDHAGARRRPARRTDPVRKRDLCRLYRLGLGDEQRQVSIGEMGGSGQGKWAGSPMAFLVRRVLEEAHTLDEAIQIFKTSKRTCEYYYVVADAKSNSAVGLEGSADRFTVVAPVNLIPNCQHQFLIRCCFRKVIGTRISAALPRRIGRAGEVLSRKGDSSDGCPGRDEIEFA